MENKLPESTLTNQQMSNEYTHRLPDPLKEPFKSKDFIWVVVKLGCLSGSLLYYGTYYLGYPKGDPNFDNHPYLPHSIKSPLHALCGGGLDDNPVLIWIYLPPRTRIALETR